MARLAAVVVELGGRGEPAAGEAGERIQAAKPQDVDGLLAQVDTMSDEELDAMLTSMLPPGEKP